MTSLLVTTHMLTPSTHKAAWMGIVFSFAWLGHAFGGFQGALAYDLTAGYRAGFAVGALAGVGNLAAGRTSPVVRPPQVPPAGARNLTPATCSLPPAVVLSVVRPAAACQQAPDDNG